MHKQWLLLSVLLLVGLASCGQVEDVATPLDTATFTPTNTNTPMPTNTPTHTPTPTATEIPCFTLIAPEDGAEFGTMGLITFEWTEQFGASQYQIEITFPSGLVESKVVEGTTYERWLESLPPGGEYSWQVMALDDIEEVICIAGSRTFTKQQLSYHPSDGDSEGNGGVDEGWDGDDGDDG